MPGSLVDAFRRRRIYPTGVTNLSEDALLWRAPEQAIPPVAGLQFAKLRFRGDPGWPASRAELRRQACALGEVVCDPRYAELFGLVRCGDPRAGGDSLSVPRVHSIRSSRRVGPDGQVVFDLVAEVTQVRRVREPDGTWFSMLGGATVILGPEGEVRYVISKSVANAARLEAQRAFIRSEAGRRYWRIDDRQPAKRKPSAQLFRLLHDEKGPEPEEA